MSQEWIVGIGDMKYASGEDRIVTFALGSCVGVTFYDPILRLGALLHVLLPESMEQPEKAVFRFADTGVRETMRQLKPLGFAKERAVVKIAGGARMFEDFSQFGGIGERNVASVRAALAREGLRISKEDVGGKTARTMTLFLKNGDVTVHSAGFPVKHL